MSCFIAVVAVAVAVVMYPTRAGLVLCSISVSVVLCVEENVVICAAGNTVTSEVTFGTRVETTVCGMWGFGVIELVITVSVDLLSSNVAGVLCVMSSASVTGDAVEVSRATVGSPEAIEDSWAAASVVSWIFPDLLLVELWWIATVVLCISGEVSWEVVSLYASVKVSWMVVSLFALVEVSWTVVSLFDAAEVSSKAVRLVACVVVTSCVVCAVVWCSKWSSQACKPSQEQVSSLFWKGGLQSSCMVHVKPEREQEGSQSGPLSASTSLLFR